MPNEQNLIPYRFTSQQSREEAAKNGAAGGRASGVSRRRKRSLRDAAEYYLSMPPADPQRWNAMSEMGVDPEDIDNQMAMIVGLTEKAIKGDAKAARIIVDLLGEKPEDGQQDGALADLIRGLQDG